VHVLGVHAFERDNDFVEVGYVEGDTDTDGFKVFENVRVRVRDGAGTTINVSPL